MAIGLEPKRADEERTYRHDWAAFLGEDTIDSQTTTGAGVTVESSAVESDSTSIRFKLTGGTNGVNGIVTQHIVTAAGEEETETFVIPVVEEEAVTLAQTKDYLRVRHDEEDAKISAMIPRARLWVEDHAGVALVKRQFVERHLPTRSGLIRLFKRPLVTVDGVDYTDGSGAAQTYAPRSFVPDSVLIAAADRAWPTPRTGEQFEVTYTAGYSVGEIDDRLTGAMLALIEGEYAEGYAYSDRAIQAARRCCAYLEQPFV